MPLHGYGLLVGTVIASRPQRSGSPHWLLMVQPGNTTHPPYRVAVNLQSTQPGSPPEVEYQVVNIDRDGTDNAKALARRLRGLNLTDNFLAADGNGSVPRLDFVRGGLLDPEAFKKTPGENPFRGEFEQALQDATEAAPDGRPVVAVFGTGYPIDQSTGQTQPTGFIGIDNIHMNQGSLNTVDGAAHFRENGPNQDGGLIFLLPNEARGLFMKFQSQTVQTDEAGNPTVTGIPELDEVSEEIRAAIRPSASAVPALSARSQVGARARAAGAVTVPEPSSGFVFADPDPEHANAPFIPDDDHGLFKTPFVMALSKGTTRGPVPTPRTYPVMKLEDVVGANPPGYRKDENGEKIVFDMAGDTGAPSKKKLPQEVEVTELMTRNAMSSQPAFLFHVGDVVYFYGEEDYYYSQFYEPFRRYPAPIFAVPGNHDGVTYKPEMVSLEAFQSAFCAPKPGRWQGSGGILRTSMTQPGVYFTLDAPLVSIVGLYSNCGETLGWLDEQQMVFLFKEMTRLKVRREAEGQATILVVHHCPRWFPGKTADSASEAIDRACTQAGFWPDAIVSGHAHIYQRIVRQDNDRDLPYIITGAGGYAVSPDEELAKDYMPILLANGTRLARFLPEAGYVRATVSRPVNGNPTLRFEYNSVEQTSNEPDDVCTIDLATNKLTV